MNNLPYNPIFYRDSIIDLCGEWDFSFDNQTWQKINVPYCPESKLSGIGYTGFIKKCYYKKTFTIESLKDHLWIHIMACDYDTKIFINGYYVGNHLGGYTPIEYEITSYTKIGENEIFIEVKDENDLHQASGKQSYKEKSFGCFYTRTTGIWQPVWLEFRAGNFIDDIKFYPNIDDSSVLCKLSVNGCGDYEITVKYDGKQVGFASGFTSRFAEVKINLSEKHLWGIKEGNLYDVEITFDDDLVHSYFGLREVKYYGYDFLLNGVKTFGNYVLVQGFNQDGIYTEPSIEFMKEDIQRAFDSGFNGIRLHEKVFDPRYLYLCDKMGIMCWGEYPNWGVDCRNMDEYPQFEQEWKETLFRDFNHPCIVTWCPLNEVWDNWFDQTVHRDIRFIDAIYKFTKNYDTTRPCCDVSGGHHGHQTDLYDFHNYGTYDEIKRCLDDFENNDNLFCNLLFPTDPSVEAPKYSIGLPVNLSEFGGFTISTKKSNVETVNVESVQSEDSWGYGDGAKSNKEFIDRYVDLVKLIKSYSKVSGCCYTQLYDVEQEENGFYTYDRKCKFSKEELERIKLANEE